MQATAQRDRRKSCASIFSFVLRGLPPGRVTCIVQVSMLHSQVTCKLQVTEKGVNIMANTVLAHVDHPNVPAVSGTGAFVDHRFSHLAGAYPCPWRTRSLRHANRGAAACITDWSRGSLGALSPWILDRPPLREFVLSADLRLIVGMQAWRWAGFGFLTLYTYRVLPGIFAWPAGLGDMAIGLTAPLILAALLRRPGFAAGNRFVAWNISGILDLAVAVSLGALVPISPPTSTELVRRLL